MSRTEEKINKLFAQLKAQPANKECMDCLATFPSYVVLDFGTFVCSFCCGIHREFNHKIKSPTMGTWKEDEVKKLLNEGGNGMAEKKWRAKWDPRKFSKPSPGSASEIRTFVKKTYIEKVWYSEVTNTSNPPVSHVSAPPTESKLVQPNPASFPTGSAQSQETQKSLIDLDFFQPNPAPTPTNPTFHPTSTGILTSAPAVNTPVSSFPNAAVSPPNPNFNPFANQLPPNPTPVTPNFNPGYPGSIPFSNPPMTTNINMMTPPTPIPNNTNNMMGLFNFNTAPINSTPPAPPSPPNNTQPFLFGFPPATTVNNNMMIPPTNPTTTSSIPSPNNNMPPTFTAAPPTSGFPAYFPTSQPGPGQTSQPVKAVDLFDFVPSTLTGQPQSQPPPRPTFSSEPITVSLPPPPPRAVNVHSHNTTHTTTTNNNSSNSSTSAVSHNHNTHNTHSSAAANNSNKPQTVRRPTGNNIQDIPTCPICGVEFGKGITNAQINSHIDECLNESALNNLNVNAPRSQPNPNPPRDTGRSYTLDNGSSASNTDDWGDLFNLNNASWYFGSIDRNEAEKILQKCQEDSFLVRKSSIKDAYALSLYNHKRQTVHHTLIQKNNAGWSFQDSAKVYKSLNEAIEKSPECAGLRPPSKSVGVHPVTSQVLLQF